MNTKWEDTTDVERYERRDEERRRKAAKKAEQWERLYKKDKEFSDWLFIIFGIE